LKVYIKNSEKKLIAVRICACKKTEAEITAEKIRIRKMESRKQRKLIFTHFIIALQCKA
jgi:ABC-type antimicrobial peptide transport system ATPase subunit